MIKFTKETIINLHDMLIKQTKGCEGIRDEGMLESAVECAFATFDGQDLFPTTEEKGARLGLALVNNHAFVDGNKRTGTFVMLTFLDANGIKMSYTNEDVYSLGVSMATGEFKQENVLSWIEGHKIDKAPQQ